MYLQTGKLNKTIDYLMSVLDIELIELVGLAKELKESESFYSLMGAPAVEEFNVPPTSFVFQDFRKISTAMFSLREDKNDFVMGEIPNTFFIENEYERESAKLESKFEQLNSTIKIHLENTRKV